MHISITAEHLFNLGPISVTNSILTTSVVVFILSIIAVLGTRKLKNTPKGFQNVVEFAIESLLKLTTNITKDEKFSRQIFPLIATFFIFILFNNWFGLIPGVGTVGFHELHNNKEVFVPLFRAGTADLNTTVVLGLTVVILTQFFGIAALGVLKYGKKFINFSSPVNFFVGILELVSEVVRVIAFAFRLFGNVFAGEVLLVVMAALVPYILPAPFYALEIFVGFIQALVFTMLALVFFSMARISHDEHPDSNENINVNEINKGEI